MTLMFTSSWLADDGFAGFVGWTELRLANVPPRPGVYVVLREAGTPPDTPPVFLPDSPAGRFKDRDPTASAAELQDAWVEGSPVVYIGKARNLRRRLREYRDHGQGKPVGHWGGRYIWQLSGSSELRIAWKVTNEDPRLLEQEMLAAFRARYGKLPFANLTR